MGNSSYLDARLVDWKGSAEPQYDQARYRAGYSVEDIQATRDGLIRRDLEAVTDIEGGPEAGGFWCYE